MLLVAGEGIGIFRLRMPIRFALRHAPLKMTTYAGVRGAHKSKVTIKVKGVGQECPSHAGLLGCLLK